MKNFISALFLLLFTLSGSLVMAAPSAAVSSTAASKAVNSKNDEIKVQTSIGAITLPKADELTDAINDLNDSSQGEIKEREKLISRYQHGLETLDKIKTLNSSLDALNTQITTSHKRIKTLIRNLKEAKAYQSISDEALDKMSEKALAQKLNTASASLFEAGIEVDTAQNYQNELQTLPEKSQSTITANDNKTKILLNELEKENDPESLSCRAIAASIYAGNLENTLYKLKISNLSTLQDLASITLELAQTKYDNLNDEVSRLTQKHKTLDSSTYSEESRISQELLDKYPEIAKAEKELAELKMYVGQAKKILADYQHDLHEIDNANTRVQMIEKNLNSQLSELNKSLILSRLLNKQLSMIPKVKIKYDVDERIANINLYLYEIREIISKETNLFEQIDDMVEQHPELDEYRTQLLNLFSKSRHAYRDLYQIVADSLNETLSIKVKYENFKKIHSKINADIEEQLFWIKSNQPIGTDFVNIFMANVHTEFETFLKKCSSREFITSTSATFIKIILPFAILAFIVMLFIKQIRQNNDTLARRLDSTTDSIWLTPLAILNNTVLMIPRVAWMVTLGAVAVCIATDDATAQTSVIMSLLLHIVIFVFFMQILKHNALAQRHFCIEPYRLKHLKNVLGSVWTFALPLLIFANVAEKDSVSIYSDVSSYAVVLISNIGLMIIAIRLMVRNIKNIQYTSASYIIFCLSGIAVTAVSAIAVINGYLYSVVKLTNRFAYSFYIVMGYFLVSQTIHRMIYVSTRNLVDRVRQKRGSKEPSKEISFMNFISVLNTTHSELCSHIYKVANTVLIFFTVVLVYLQWNDLASVLRYLDTVHLWNKYNLENGQVVITDYLSVANVLFALIVVVITALLNKTIPLLLEKLLLIKKDARLKSTSYSVKVISSYIIIGLGITMAAGALGIKWENLQWLVAALSVGLGFGLQEIFANFVSGIILLFERELRVGDIVTINGLSGTVAKIRIRSTTVTSFENKEVMIPNRSFITSALTNWSLTNTITRLDFDIGVAYGSNLEKAKECLRSVINRCRYIAKDKVALVYVNELAASSINIRCEVYVGDIGNRKATIDYLSIESINAFNRAGIEIPFDQLDLNVKTLEKDEFVEKLRKGLFASSAENELSAPKPENPLLPDKSAEKEEPNEGKKRKSPRKEAELS